jgi:signal peptidase complex subunit 3
VEFATPKNPDNNMVMWSKIVERPEEALLRVPRLRAGYPFSVTDQGHELLGREFNVTVAWNVMPRVGALFTQRRTFAGIAALPSDYVKAEKGNIRRAGARGAEAPRAREE